MLQFGKILSFPKKKGKEGEVCRVVWYYKPEDLKSGRKSFHGKKELLASDHEDPVPEGSIIGHAKVHTLLEYEALKTVGKYDFFSRFTYHMATGAFVPDQVPVLCVCRLPYNPDSRMVSCDTCGEWYHIACLDDNAAS
ncbi:MAG: hypothetical protein WDW38_010517 [Sanguina aurantia]